MKFTCTNIRKTNTLQNGETLTFGSDTLSADRTYYFPASLTQEHAQLFMVLRNEYKKKKLLHFKSQSWLQDIDDDEDDDEAVATLNSNVLASVPTPNYMRARLKNFRAYPQDHFYERPCISGRRNTESRSSILSHHE